MITDFRQVDKAILEKLKGLQVIDEYGKLIDVDVIYINPEVEFKVSKYPAFIVYRQGIFPDNYRWTNDKFYDNPVYDETGALIHVDEREAPDPYNVYYGIRLYYEYQKDGVKLNQHIMSKLRRGAFLDIEGSQYDVFFVSYRNPEATYRTYGELQKKEQREFYEQYLYKVEIELDNATRDTVPITQGLISNINTQNKED